MDHSFKNELKIIPEEHNVILTEVIHNPKYHREKKAQIMFETLNVKSLSTLEIQLYFQLIMLVYLMGLYMILVIVLHKLFLYMMER